MKRNWAFVIILLATLSVANAIPFHKILHKRDTAFSACPSKAPPFETPAIDPKTPIAGKTATLSVSIAKAPTTITAAKVNVDCTDDTGSLDGFPQTTDFCAIGGIKCPVVAGSSITLDYPIKIPVTAPKAYSITFRLTDTGTTGTDTDIACTVGDVTGAEPAKAPPAKAPPAKAKDAKGPKGPGPDGEEPKAKDGEEPKAKDGEPKAKDGEEPKAKDGEPKAKDAKGGPGGPGGPGPAGPPPPPGPPPA